MGGEGKHAEGHKARTHARCISATCRHSPLQGCGKEPQAKAKASEPSKAAVQVWLSQTSINLEQVALLQTHGNVLQRTVPPFSSK